MRVAYSLFTGTGGLGGPESYGVAENGFLQPIKIGLDFSGFSGLPHGDAVPPNRKKCRGDVNLYMERKRWGISVPLHFPSPLLPRFF